jgi:predicted acyltransferase
MNNNKTNNKRLMSLDALRGFDMMFIMGFSGLVMAICALFPGGEECWLSTTMEHVKWNGLAHHDTIFPLFLFIAGISFPFSYSKQLSNGMSTKQIYGKIIKRFFILVALGVVYNGFFKLDFANLRICSVLGRIGFAWAVAAVLFINFKPMTRAIIAAATLIGYWLLICYVPAPDVPGANPLTIEGNLIGYIDRLLMPGRLIYDGGRFDPEGLLSTVPAVVTAMLGMFTGEFVRISDNKISGNRKSAYMGIAAAIMLAVGLIWSLVFPINKMLWTSSFVLVVGAYSLGMFALFYYIIDVRKWQKWTLFFRVIGLNSITIYMAQRIVSFSGINKFFFGGLADMLPAQWGDLLLRFGYVAVCWLFLYFLYKKQTFLKI